MHPALPSVKRVSLRVRQARGPSGPLKALGKVVRTHFHPERPQRLSRARKGSIMNSDFVFKEARKAETKLKNLRKARERQLQSVNSAYDVREQTLIAKLDVQVRAALRFVGVLERAQVESPEDEDETVDVDFLAGSSGASLDFLEQSKLGQLDNSTAEAE